MMATAGRNMQGVLCVFIFNLTELLFTLILATVKVLNQSVHTQL
jgi:hypothetical protein